jgi:hypothetical protein
VGHFFPALWVNYSPALTPLQCFKYEWTVLPFAQQQTEDDECLSGSKIREQVAHFFMSMSGSKIREQVAHFLVDIHTLLWEIEYIY